MKRTKHVMATLLMASLIVLEAHGQSLPNDDSQTAPQAIQQSPEKLQQLVAPIALYPDSLIAQVLAGATYPEEIVDASKWMQNNNGLSGTDLASQVDQQPWDASVKALTQFPSVLANMSKNLAWTSELGDANVNQQSDVMQAIQVMRQQAKTAGNLQSTDQQKVKTDGNTIVIEPSAPDVVYVPQYNPWLVYGYPLSPFPGWYSYPGLFLSGPGIGWGLGFNIGFFGGFGWGWGHWGYDWHHGGRGVVFNHNVYISHSRTIIRRDGFRDGRGFDRGGAGRGGFNRGPARSDGFHGRVDSGTHSSAFSGFNRGGEARMSGFRGQSSFGGGGGFRGGGGGGGGFHGGGGGGRR